MKAVCRTILLHNEFIPAIAGKREWKYQVLGHHDGMTVGEVINLDEEEPFEKLFQINAEYEGQKANYSTQYFYGFHYDADKERCFWNIEAPFVFVSFLQLAERNVVECQRYLESEQYIQSEKNKIVSPNDAELINSLAYFAMDASDIILVIKCTKCESGAALINHLHHNLEKDSLCVIRNSYSVLALDRRYIEESSKTEEVKGNIDLLELRIIERKGGSVDGLYQQLHELTILKNPQSQIERKALLGTEDEAIIIKNIPWKSFMPLYKAGTGILCNANECANIFAAAISAKLFHFMEDYVRISDKGEGKNSDSALVCDYLYERIVELYRGKRTNNDLTEYKNFIMLINAFRKVENSWHAGTVFLDYSFFPMIFPFAVFVILHETSRKNQHQYYNFINRLRLCTQNFTKPNRVFSQVADFNIRYFDIPSKFLAFYNAYIYQVKKLLNTRPDRQYEFLVCPGLINKTAVEEVYPRLLDKIHLFSVEIPEEQMYMIKLMLITLGHEVSHFVGTDLRQRDKRFESIIKICGRMTILAMRNYIEYIDIFEAESLQDEILWKEIEDNMDEEIRFCLMRYQNIKYLRGVFFAPGELTDEQLDNQKRYYEAYLQHTEVLKKIIYESVDDILNIDGFNLFEEVIWRSFDAAVKKGKQKYDNRDIYVEKYKNEMLRCVELFMGRGGEKHRLTISNGIEHIMCLLEECYADMICILSLELSIKDYLYSIIKTLDSLGFGLENIYDKIVIARIAIVLSVLCYDMEGRGKKENDFKWSAEDSLQLSEDDRILKLYRMAESFAKRCIKEQMVIPKDDRIADSQTIICDRKILGEIIIYLLRCKENYSYLIDRDKKAPVKEFYLLSKGTDIRDMFGSMLNILQKYEQDIYSNIPAWIQADKNRKRK